MYSDRLLSVPERDHRAVPADQPGVHPFPSCSRGRGDQGFTVVETVIAMVLLALVMAGTATLVVHGLLWTAQVDRRVTATMIANRALEAARAPASQVDPTGTTALLTGRTPQSVNAVPAADVDLSDMTLAFDPNAAGTATVPLTSAVAVDGTTYDLRTFIGTCRRPLSGGSCTRGGNPGTSVTLYRVLAAVRWPGCSAPACPVQVATLLDTSADPPFDGFFDLSLKAVNDSFDVPMVTSSCANPAAYVTPAANDTGRLGNEPITIVGQPVQGTVTTVPGSPGLLYRAPAGYVGTDSFSYTLTDVYGKTSDPATVTLTVGGTTC